MIFMFSVLYKQYIFYMYFRSSIGLVYWMATINRQLQQSNMLQPKVDCCCFFDLAITKNYVRIEKWQEQKFLFSCNTSCIIFYFVREFCVYIFLCILLTYHIQFPSIIEFVWSWALNRLNNIYNNQSNFCSLFWCPDDDTGAQHPSPPPAATSWPPPPPLSTGTDPASSWNGPG